MPAVGSREPYAGYTLDLFILPISILPTLKLVACSPEWTEGIGNAPIPVQLIKKGSRRSGYFVLNLMLDKNSEIQLVNEVFPNRPILYFIGLRITYYDGLGNLLDGTGRQRLSLYWAGPILSSWKLGYSMVMQLTHFDSSTTLTIDA